MTLRLKIILVSAVLILVVLITSGRVISALNNAENDADIINALGRQRMLSQAMAKSALGYASKGEYNILKNQTLVLNNYITKMRMMYTKHVIPAAKRAGMGISMTPDKETEPSVPFPATLTRMVNEAFGHIEDFSGREISIDIIAKIPVNPKSGYITEQDRKAGEYLERSPGDMYNSTLEEDGKLYLLFYTADIATVEACSSCHSSIRRKNFTVGDMLGIRRFKMLLSKDVASGYAQLNPSLDEYTNAKIIFYKTLLAMKAGGEYPADLKMTKSKKVGAINDKAAQKKMVDIESKFAEFTKVVDGLISSGENSSIFDLQNAILLESNNLRKLSGDLVNIYTNIANRNQGQIYWFTILTSVLVILITVGMAVYLIFAVIIPINKTTASLKDMAEGEKDLTQRLANTRTDEIGELSKWFNAFVSGLRNLIQGIMEITDHLASSATELYTTAEQSYKGTEKQSGQVGEVAASMEEMSATISEVARKSFAVSESAKSASEAASTGGKVVSKAIKGMSSIENSVKESATIIEELGKSSQHIGEIISVINDIADQTNLLALNAAIEAARAGEQGRGFAVVADEVRKLAERTTKATKEISVMIQTIQSNTLKAVSSMEGGTRDVSSGVQLINQAGKSLENIMNMIASVTANVEGIATSSEQQSATAEDISKNTIIASEVSDELSVAAEQSSKSAKQVSLLAEQLKAMVEQFKL